MIHKASEGDFYADPVRGTTVTGRRRQGCCGAPTILARVTHPVSSRRRSFSTRPALLEEPSLPPDLEANEGDPSNSMTLEQAEAFVQAVANSTGRLPLVYIHRNWASGGVRVTANSILARCGLWVVDYGESPRIPSAWATRGWRLWQYASGQYSGRPRYSRTVHGVSDCDRNLFNGDAAALSSRTPPVSAMALSS